MFLNFPLHPNARKHCGVNLKGIKEIDLGVKRKDHMVWTTLWMGFAPSSANAVKHLGLAQEIAAGDPLNIENPFHWSEIVLNLPGSDKFNPRLPWVYKLNKVTNRIAGDFVTFVDDIRVTGFSVENCWKCGRCLSSSLQYLGIQDAAGKKKPPTLEAGSWSGCIAQSNGDAVFRTITLEKWEKGKNYLLLLRNKMGTRCNPAPLERKLLERIRGFFNHLAMTFDVMLPFLKGFHNTIEGWR